FRLYSRFGLDTVKTGQVLAFSLITNWLGYLLILGCILVASSPSLPEDWGVSGWQLKVAGALRLGFVGAYLAMASFSKKRRWKVRSFDIQLPSLGLAAIQLFVSAGSWTTVAVILHILLGPDLAFGQVLFAALAAAVAGVVTHIPGGLGVMEFV